MTLPPFELHRPASLDEASELLRAHGDAAAVLCGGTELVLLMKLGFAEPAHLVDVKGVEELRGLQAEGGVLSIGAATTHRELERSTLLIEAVLTDYLDSPWDSYRRRRFVHDVVRVAGLFSQAVRQEESTLLPLYMPPGQYRYIDGADPLAF